MVSFTLSGGGWFWFPTVCPPLMSKVYTFTTLLQNVCIMLRIQFQVKYVSRILYCLIFAQIALFQQTHFRLISHFIYKFSWWNGIKLISFYCSSRSDLVSKSKFFAFSSETKKMLVSIDVFLPKFIHTDTSCTKTNQTNIST